MFWVIPIYALFWPSTNSCLSKIRRLLRIDEHSYDKRTNSIQTGDESQNLSDNDEEKSDIDEVDYGAANKYFGGAT